MKLWKIIPILSFLGFAACGPRSVKHHDPEPTEKKRFLRCGYLGERLCSRNEIAFIRDLEYLAHKIRSLAGQSDLLEHFHERRSLRHLPKSKVHFLGERHTDLFGQLDNYAYIEKELGPNAVILFEGAEAGTKIEDCAWYIMLNLRCVLEDQRRGIEYQPEERGRFCAEAFPIWSQVKKELSAEFSNLSQAQCYFWDTVRRNDDYSLSLARYRNASLVRSLQVFEAKESVFVLAGSLHSPVGEYAYFKSKSYGLYGLTPYLKSLYEVHKDETSTQDIYDYLMTVPTKFLLHKRLVDAKHLPSFL